MGRAKSVVVMGSSNLGCFALLPSLSTAEVCSSGGVDSLGEVAEDEGDSPSLGRLRELGFTALSKSFRNPKAPFEANHDLSQRRQVRDGETGKFGKRRGVTWVLEHRVLQQVS